MKKLNKFVASVALIAGLAGGWAAREISGDAGCESRPVISTTTTTAAPVTDLNCVDEQGHLIGGLTPEQLASCL